MTCLMGVAVFCSWSSESRLRLEAGVGIDINTVKNKASAALGLLLSRDIRAIAFPPIVAWAIICNLGKAIFSMLKTRVWHVKER